MARRRIRHHGGTSLVPRQETGELRHLTQVVRVGFELRHARTWLARHLGNVVRTRLVEVQRGEPAGVVRLIEVQHADGRISQVRGERQLANGQPASFYVPDQLVTIKPVVLGALADGQQLHRDDRVVLHVPVQGYLRFLPAIFQGEGPVQSQQIARQRDTALQRWRGGELAPENVIDDVVDADPMRRFLFIFQHLMTSLTDQIDDLPQLTDPLRCPPTMLPWLASWVGFELDGSLPVHQQRELVRRAIRLMRTRGTKEGIQEMVRVLTATPVEIEERRRPTSMVLGKAHLVGGKTVVDRFHKNEPPGAYLVDAPNRAATSFFTLRLESREDFQRRFGERAPAVLRRIAKVVSQERPTHVSFVIRFGEKLQTSSLVQERSRRRRKRS